MYGSEKVNDSSSSGRPVIHSKYFSQLISLFPTSFVEEVKVIWIELTSPTYV